MEEPPDFTIRLVTKSDINQLADYLGEESFRRISSLPDEERRRALQQLIDYIIASEQSSLYVAIINGKIVAYIHVHWLPYLILNGIEGYISELFVLENNRGSGIGRRLLQIVESEAQEKNAVRLNLINSTDRESYQRGFYEKQGFHKREEFVNFVK